MRFFYLAFLRTRYKIKFKRRRYFFSKNFEPFDEFITIDEAYSKIIEASKSVILHKKYKNHTETSYSKMIKENLVDFLCTLERSNILSCENIEMIFVQGSVATGCAVPLHLIQNKKTINQQTGVLLSLYYNWILSQEDINTKYTSLNSFVFNHSFGSDIDIVVYIKNSARQPKERLSKILQDMFVERFGFSPHIDCSYKSLTKENQTEVLKA